MSFTLLSVAILVITAAIIYRQVRWGYKHGLSRSLINLAVLLSCAFFATVVSVFLVSILEEPITALMDETGLYKLLDKTFGIFTSAVIVIIRMLLSLVLYLPIFFICRGISAVMTKIIYALFVKKKRKKSPSYLSEDELHHVKKDKKLGAILGIVSGFILSVVVFTPLVGVLRSADDVLDIIESYADIPAIEDSEELELVGKYSDDISCTVISACGGGVLYDLSTRTVYDGQSTYLSREIEMIEKIDINKTKAELEGNGALNADTISKLEPLLNDVSGSVILKLMAVEVVKDASETWIDGGEYWGISRPSIGSHKAMDEFLNQILYACSTTTFESYDADLKTLLSIVDLFQKNEAVFKAADYSTLAHAMNEGGFLQQLEAELNKNPHMNLVSFAINDMIMDVLAEEIVDRGKYSDNARNLLYKEIASALSDTQGLSGSVRDVELANYLSESFSKFGVDVPDKLNGRVAEILSDKVATMDGRVTDKEVKKFIEECVYGAQ